MVSIVIYNSSNVGKGCLFHLLMLTDGNLIVSSVCISFVVCIILYFLMLLVIFDSIDFELIVQESKL